MQSYKLPINGTTQRKILSSILDRKDGMTVDELVDQFGIGRSAVNQHLTALERDGYVEVGRLQKSRGRPRKVYVLTEDGVNLFPKKYSWFSALLLQVLQNQIGTEQLGDYMRNLGAQLALDQRSRVDGKRPADKIPEIVKIMNETGFEAKAIPSQGDETIPRIECKNCVYHDLARDYTQVCQFDLGFLSGLMGHEIEHQECMVRGGRACRFRFAPQPAPTPGARKSRRPARTKSSKAREPRR